MCIRDSYTVIYVVLVMLVAMLGFIPIFIPLMAVLCTLIGGIPYMLYVTKAKKFGMTAIMGFLIGLIMAVSYTHLQKQDRTQEMPEFSVTVTPYEREDSNIKGLARIYSPGSTEMSAENLFL